MRRSPSRRAFAALAASAVAGCVSVPNGDSPNDGPTNERDPADDSSSSRDRVQTTCTTSLASPDPFPDLQIEYDDVPEDADVAMCVQPAAPFTAESPAKIAVELTNLSDSSVEFHFGVTPPWGGLWADHRTGDAVLYLVPDDREHVVPAEGVVPSEAADGCWYAESSIEVESIGLAETVGRRETIREEYAVLASPDSECLASGTYRTEEGRYDPIKGGWGFDITLSG